MDLEVYYTQEEFDHGGITRLTGHIRQYFRGERTIPVAKTHSEFGKDITFTFSNALLKSFLEEPERIRKPFEVALKYGFRGVSQGGRNGIFMLRKQDGGLLEDLVRLETRNREAIEWDLELWMSQGVKLQMVKIVYHDTSGERVVGVFNGQNKRIIFLGFGSY